MNLRATAQAAVLLLGTTTANSHAQTADALRGRALYESRCIACHSVDTHRIGPAHRGIAGRQAGQLPGYDYSAALARSALRWSASNLDAWLKDPEALVPGQKMGYSVASAQDRQDLVAFLLTLK